MLNEEKESLVMQIQILDEDSYWTRRTVFLVMDDKLDWEHAYLNKVCGKYSKIFPTCKKVKYV